MTDQDLGGLTLTPGVYCFSSSAPLTGTLTLDAQGDPDALFAFQIATTLVTASDSSVLLIGGSVCTVYWQVGSSATLGTNTAFAGNILALQSITLNTGASIAGRALARNGAVTMDTNDVSAPACITEPAPTATPQTPTATVPANPRTPTAAVPTATSVTPATVSPQPSAADATLVPGTPAPNTAVPGATVPPTAVSTTPAPIVTPISPIPGPPSGGIPTVASTIEETAVPTAPILGTATSVASIVETSVPGPQTAVATVDATAVEIIQTPGGGLVETAVDVTPVAPSNTPSAPTGTFESPSSTPEISTSTPAASVTASPVPPVYFPKTGSGGLLGADQAPIMSISSLAIVISIIMLMTGGFGIMVEKRSRH